ncbi:MAG: DNA-processing protein DprA [Candidatus Saccharibacteria bacterium]
MDIEKACLVAFIGIAGLGYKGILKLRERFGTYQAAWSAPLKQLSDVVGPKALPALAELRGELDPERQLQRYTDSGIFVIAEYEELYPVVLKQIHSWPPALFCRGRIDALRQPAVGIVGSRKATPYGRKVARMLGRELAESGVIVVSGLARGIDAEAHWGALDGGGYTIGILGNGPDIVYPRENKELYQKVAERGLIMSEWLPGTAPDAKNFPIRNRIISGLSNGVVVVEAQERSGALITVDFALEQGRDVFAVPGPITSETSTGTNNLIKQGAKMIGGTKDILDELRLGIDYSGNNHNNMQERAFNGDIIDYISSDRVHIDQLLVQSGLSYGLLSAKLLVMELEGRIKTLPGNYYVRV